MAIGNLGLTVCLYGLTAIVKRGCLFMVLNRLFVQFYGFSMPILLRNDGYKAISWCWSERHWYVSVEIELVFQAVARFMT